MYQNLAPTSSGDTSLTVINSYMLIRSLLVGKYGSLSSLIHVYISQLNFFIYNDKNVATYDPTVSIASIT